MKLRRLFHMLTLATLFNTVSATRTHAPRHDSRTLPDTTQTETPRAETPDTATIDPFMLTWPDSTGNALAAKNPIYASILVDSASGTVMTATNPDKKLHPASTTKILTAYMVFEAIENGSLKMDQMLTVKAHGTKIEPSLMGLRAGQKISVEDALQGLIVESANDAAILFAQVLGGTPKKFVAMMNAKAKEIGMNKSHFVNPHGLPYNLGGSRAEKSVTTVRDMATLAARTLKDFPQYFAYFSQQEFKYKGRLFESHNKMLPKISAAGDTTGYWGMDGFKTGYTKSSGCNLVATAVRDGKRLFVVSFGHAKGVERTADVARLLDHGFERLKLTQSMTQGKNMPTFQAPAGNVADGTRYVRPPFPKPPRQL